MARIRSIKPEFPQSETVGRLSRDARLLFIQLWTIVDDLGRARAASRMLASLLYPYDDDVPGLIDGWLSELEHEHCLIRYEVEGTTYLQLTNWLKHQKIDHPSASKHPAPQPILANPREPSLILAPRARAPDLGPRIGIRKEDAEREDIPPAAALNGSALDADLYRRGKEVLGKNSGGMIKNLLASKNGSIPQARAALETASEKQDCREYIGAIIRGRSRESCAAADDLIT